jgi:hypothetical protein
MSIDRSTAGQSGGFLGPAGPPDQRLYPGKQFRESKGFAQVVVTAGLKAPDPVVNAELFALRMITGVITFSRRIRPIKDRPSNPGSMMSTTAAS